MEEPTSTEFEEDQQAEEKKKQVPNEAPPSKLNSNFYARTRTTVLMLLGFFLILSAGPIYCALLIMILNVMIFAEINGLKRNEEKEVDIPMTKYINWFIFLVSNYYCLGNLVSAKIPILGVWSPLIRELLAYHNFICFSLFVLTFLTFVISLRQGYLKYQFRLFGWIVIATILVTFPGWLMIQNIFQGVIWYLMPAMLVICNDIFAYLFGYFFGKHKLISISPKKTWEGYIGGALSSVFFSLILSSALGDIEGITCKMVYPTLMPFSFPSCQSSVLETVVVPLIGVTITKLQAHSLFISLFASIIAPFGGFFASGIKRAIKIKDFANLIPGHGGVSDRMDCQVIMGSFTYFYIHAFVLDTSLAATAAFWIGLLSPYQKIQLYKALGTILAADGLL